ncbi:uncharacterized protein VTP21DRAFT_1471 [Calcarisporiella thermophila]|uniref:uncharacterized protein n=1 Tax=Calcarisporiella thermophila TaxID=911321 RepID=UPI003742477B
MSKEPTTFDEYMEEGIALEDKAERYGGSGDRAQRFYERAAQFYGKAHELNKEDGDCLYNWGRVLYLLNDFHSASDSSQRLALVDQAVSKFRASLSITPDNPDTLFNLAQALVTLAELVDNESESERILQEATTIFEQVFKLQENTLAQQEENEKNVNESEPDGEEPRDEDEDEDDEKITKDILVDTLLATINALISLAYLKPQPDASRLYREAISKIQQALTFAEESRTIEIQLQWASALSSQAERAWRETARCDARLFEEALEKLEECIAKDPKHVEALCDKGDVLVSYAQARSQMLAGISGKEQAEEERIRIWNLYAYATKAYQTALEQEPENASILAKTGDICLIRARLPFGELTQKSLPALIRNALHYYRRGVKAAEKGADMEVRLCLAQTLEFAQKSGVESNAREELEQVLKEWRMRKPTQESLIKAAEESDVLDGEFVERLMLWTFGPPSNENITLGGGSSA